MPPKRGPAARKLHDSLPPKTEIPCKIYSPLVITKEIGKGGFGRIYSGKTKDTKEDVAIKVEQNGSGGLFVEFQIFRSFLSEKDLNEYKKQKRLQFLGLPHFVAWGVFTHKGTELRFVAMPLYTGSLQEYINKKSGKNLDVDECKEIIPSVCDAYDYLHSKDIVHADLKAENLMFSKSYPNRLDRLTLIDFGMCGRRSHEIVDQPDKGKAHNGTALFTSTDAHRGCAPSYRADYEILGHNLLAWLAGVQNIPWNNVITKLDQVHSLKSKIIDSKGDIQKLVGSPEAASLVYEVYQVAKKTNYKQKVDSGKVKKLASSIKSPKKSVVTPRSKKGTSAEEESPALSNNVIPSSPPVPVTPRRVKKSASEQPEISLEAQRRAQAESREARAKRRNRVEAIPEEEIESRKRPSEEPEDSGEAKKSKVEQTPKSAGKKLKKADSLDVTLSPTAVKSLAKKFPGIKGFSRITKQMEAKYGSKK